MFAEPQDDGPGGVIPAEVVVETHDLEPRGEHQRVDGVGRRFGPHPAVVGWLPQVVYPELVLLHTLLDQVFLPAVYHF